MSQGQLPTFYKQIEKHLDVIRYQVQIKVFYMCIVERDRVVSRRAFSSEYTARTPLPRTISATRSCSWRLR